jgi:hypothetical protein
MTQEELSPMSTPEPTGSSPRRTAVRDNTAAQLEAAWAELERQGAAVRRRDLPTLPDDALNALLRHECQRIRALAERDLPAPAPFDWRSYRRRTEGRVFFSGGFQRRVA